MMRYGIAFILIALAVGCSSRPAPLEVLLSSGGTTIVNGAPMTDAQLLDLANTIRFNHRQSFPLTIRADDICPLARIERVASIVGRAGLWQIRIGRVSSDSATFFYPKETTNEFAWDDLLIASNSISIRTNAGVNVRLLPDGARIESSSATMPQLLEHLASLAGSDRARVVITAGTNAPHGSLVAVLETCEEHHIDPFYVEHWLEEDLAQRRPEPEQD